MGFDNVKARVVVTDGDQVTTGNIVFEELASVPVSGGPWTEEDEQLFASVDELLAVAPRVITQQLGIAAHALEVRAIQVDQGGDQSSVELVIHLVSWVQDLAWQGLAALFLQHLYDELKKKSKD
jgi:hypothetical protein